MPDPDWWHALWANPDGVMAAVGIVPGMTVLDLCCGDGYFTAAIARRVNGGTVVGVDLDEQMLTAARTACAGLANCVFIKGDAMALERWFPEPIDYCLMANTFHGVPEQTALAREVAHILKPGGMFTVINWHAQAREQTPVLGEPRGPRTEWRMTPAQVCAVVEPAGLRRDRVVELLPYHYAALFRSPA